MRNGTQPGPDISFLGVGHSEWSDPATYPDADAVILGAPFDGGTPYRSSSAATTLSPGRTPQAWPGKSARAGYR
jgi:hypothetical protein